MRVANRSSNYARLSYAAFLVATVTLVLLALNAADAHSQTASRLCISVPALAHLLLYVVALFVVLAAVSSACEMPRSWLSVFPTLFAVVCSIPVMGLAAVVVVDLLLNADDATSQMVNRVVLVLALSCLLFYSIGLILFAIAARAKSHNYVFLISFFLNLTGFGYVTAGLLSSFGLAVFAVVGLLLLWFVFVYHDRASRSAIGLLCSCIVVLSCEFYVFSAGVAYRKMHNEFWSMRQYEEDLERHRSAYAAMWWLHDNTRLRKPIHWYLNTF